MLEAKNACAHLLYVSRQYFIRRFFIFFRSCCIFFFCSCVHWARINKAISNLFALLKFFVSCSLFSIMWFYVILVFTTYLFSYFRLSQTPKRERKFTRNFLDDTCHQHFFSLFFYFLIFRNYWHEHTFISRPTKKPSHDRIPSMNRS